MQLQLCPKKKLSNICKQQNELNIYLNSAKTGEGSVIFSEKNDTYEGSSVILRCNIACFNHSEPKTRTCITTHSLSINIDMYMYTPRQSDV